MSQNIGCRQPSRYAAKATAPPLGRPGRPRAAEQEQVDDQLEVEDGAP